MQAHAHIEPEKRKAYGSRPYPAQLASFPIPSTSRGFFTAEVRHPQLPMAVPSSKTRKPPSWGKGSTCEMEKPQGKGTSGGWSWLLQQATKQEAVEDGNGLRQTPPADSNLTGLLCLGGASPLRRLGSRELEGFEPLGG